MGFTKLDEGIIFSSVMLEPPDVFKVWITMLAMCKSDGVCRASSVGISAISHLDLDTVDKALVILESPDTRSRSINDEGRRIRRIDGGYEIINYMKYRELSKNEAEARRKWEKRNCPDMSGRVQTSADSSASASGLDSKEDTTTCAGTYNTSKPYPDQVRAQMSPHRRRVVEAYPKKTAHLASMSEWAQAVCGMSEIQEAEFADKCIVTIERWKRSEDWKNPTYIPDLRSWLKDGRWDDVVPSRVSGVVGKAQC